MKTLYLLAPTILLMAWTSTFWGCAKVVNSTDCNLSSVLCSCDRRTVATNPDCRDYEAMSVTKAQADCSKNSGTFSSSASCPTATKVGTCRYSIGSEVSYYRYYQASVTDAAAGSAACAYIKANCFVVTGGQLCDASWSVP